MNTDQIWAAIDTQRGGVAEVLEPLTPEQWTTPSLCEGWRVRDVAAHLTHSHMAPGKAMIEAVKSGFRFDPMIRRLAIEDSRSQAQIVSALRAMVGSRRKVPMTSDRDPLTDILVHTQDITVPFGGFKQSGVGRDKSLHAFDKYTETKTTWIRIDSPV